MLQSFSDYLENVLKFVTDELRSGKTTAGILKAAEIPGSGDGIERPLTAAFEELGGS